MKSIFDEGAIESITAGTVKWFYNQYGPITPQNQNCFLRKLAADMKGVIKQYFMQETHDVVLQHLIRKNKELRNSLERVSANERRFRTKCIQNGISLGD